MTVFFLGLDGASLEIIASTMKAADLPNFRTMLAAGRHSRLPSVYPYVSGPAWTSIFSGVNPGKHGIFDNQEMDGKNSRPPNMRRCDVPFLWDYLTWANKRSLILGVPFIYPAPRINGIFVTGSFVPTLSCSPESLREEVDLSGYKYDLPAWKFPASQKQAFVQERLGALQRRVEVSSQLVDQEEWDVVVIVDMLPDSVLHKQYGDPEITITMIRQLDGFVGQILRRCRKEDLFILGSDHGHSANLGVFYINSWLRSKGYISTDWKLGKRILAPLVRPAPMKTATRRLLKTYRAIMKDEERRSQSRGQSVGGVAKVGKQTVVALNTGEQVAWINALGDSSEVSGATENQITRDLAGLKKEGILQNVFRTGDLFHGKFIPKVPGQFLIEARDGLAVDTKTFFDSPISERLTGPADKRRPGMHRRDGLIAIHGGKTPRFDRVPSILDITPTILKACGLFIPASMDGKPLIE